MSKFESSSIVSEEYRKYISVRNENVILLLKLKKEKQALKKIKLELKNLKYGRNK